VESKEKTGFEVLLWNWV